MADVFNLPAVGDTMVEGEIVEWFVAVGDTIDLDQVICSLETDKSVVEMSTPYRGTVLQLGAAPGEAIEVGMPLIVVGQPGESVPEAAAPVASSSAGSSPKEKVSYGSTTAPAAAASADGGGVLSPVVRKLAKANSVDAAALVGTGVGGRVTRADVEAAIAQPAQPPTGAPGTVRAMPKVRKAAREQSIDLAAFTGSGPHGSITLADLSNGSAARASGTGERRQRLSAMRRSIASHLTESVQTVPQFTSMVECDATAVLATRAALADRLGTPVPIDAVLMAVLVSVLKEHPIANAMLDGDEIVYFGHYNMGVAVDTDQGLVVPVVRHADQLSMPQLVSEIMRLATAARERTIQPHELSGATCTVNNVGSLGILYGTPILPLGTSTIVAFGRARPVVQLVNGNAVEVPTMTLSGTFDHRLIDGGDSGRFLAQLKQHLEVPALAFL